MKLVTKHQMNEIDAKAIQGYQIPGLLLMEHAAYGMFQTLVKRIQPQTKIQVVCGMGNNGGDGLALARFLQIAGYSVCYSLVGSHSMSPDCLANAQMVQAMNIPKSDTLEAVDVIVDAIFGTGFHGNIPESIKQWIEKINQHPATVYSIDVPSGILADTGECLEVAVVATETFTIHAGKVGLYVYPGSACAGKVTIIDLWVPPCLLEETESKYERMDLQMMKQYLPSRMAHSHKGSYGKILAIGGSSSMSGAISLASKAMFASGCGMVTCAVCQSIQKEVQTNVLEAMTIALPQKDGHIAFEAKAIIEEQLSRFDCVLAGCGLTKSEELRPLVEYLLQCELPLVLDADAIALAKPLLNQYATRTNLILTPHLKEFADLMDLPLELVEQHRMKVMEQFSERYPNMTLVLKSETTIVAQNDKRMVHGMGNNGLAVAGSGDVLAGIITGLLAQNGDVWKASCLGVALHGLTADLLLEEKSVYSMIPSNIIEALERTIRYVENTNNG